MAVGGEPIQASVTEAVAPLIPHLVYFAGAPLTLKQARVGSILIGGGWPARLRDRQPLVDRDSLLANLSVATRVVPAVAQARLLRTWAGFVNATTSWLPVIGELPGCPGLFIGAFPYMGFTAGPLLGRTLAELVCGRGRRPTSHSSHRDGHASACVGSLEQRADLDRLDRRGRREAGQLAQRLPGPASGHRGDHRPAVAALTRPHAGSRDTLDRAGVSGPAVQRPFDLVSADSLATTDGVSGAANSSWWR